jgi:hypothetical protein
MYFQWEKNNYSVQRDIAFGSLSLERFLTLSSTNLFFLFCRPSLKGSEENMVALTLNGSALSRLMMPSKLSFGNKQLQMFTWLVEEKYNFGMLHSSCLLHALSTTCFMLALEYLSHTLNYYQKNWALAVCVKKKKKKKPSKTIHHNPITMKKMLLSFLSI